MCIYYFVIILVFFCLAFSFDQTNTRSFSVGTVSKLYFKNTIVLNLMSSFGLLLRFYFFNQNVNVFRQMKAIRVLGLLALHCTELGENSSVSEVRNSLAVSHREILTLGRRTSNSLEKKWL